MIRRIAFAPLVLVAVLAIVVAACGSATPARPEITDPKQVLSESLATLKDIKTFEFTTAFSGTVEMAELGGSLDLSTTTMSGAFDIAAKKFKLTLDAPSIMGTKVEALGVDGFSYVKISGLLAGMMGGEAGKWMKAAMADTATEVVEDPAELQKQIDEFTAALEKLPTPPTFAAAEKCGNVDCYHVVLKASSDDLSGISGGLEAGEGDATIDFWSSKNDLRPAKLGVSVVSPELGTIGIVMSFTYDVSVSVDAPPADQVIEE